MATGVEVEAHIVGLDAFHGLTQYAGVKFSIINVATPGADIQRYGGKVALIFGTARGYAQAILFQIVGVVKVLPQLAIKSALVIDK